ncbi:MAG: 30S ribosomal protein S17 [Patescibacteria group bacterium]
MDNPILKGKMLTGTVVSDKMMKTVVVEVTRLKLHPKYKKQFKVSTKYKAHDAEQQYHIGDKVVIRETRPISKDKKWIVESKV